MKKRIEDEGSKTKKQFLFVCHPYYSIHMVALPGSWKETLPFGTIDTRRLKLK